MATVVDVQEEQLLIGGKWTDASSGERFDVTNPATGDVVGTVPNGTAEDVSAAIDAASTALPEWQALPAIAPPPSSSASESTRSAAS